MVFFQMLYKVLFTGYCRLYQLVLKMVSPLLPWREPDLLEGPDSLLRLPALMRERGLLRVLIVTDRSIVGLGLLEPLLEGLKAQEIAYAIFDETVPNPTIGNIESGLRMFHAEGCQCLLAFGGGSPIDCAKGIGARAARPHKSLSRMKGILKVGRRIPPLIAVPTTAGTGSEATLAAVVSNPDTHEKYPINDHALIPHYAVLDPLLTISLPPSITASTGMDALTHAVEAYIGRSGTRETDADSIEAVRLILGNLTEVFRNGNDVDGRGNLLKAAYLAGKAFTRAYIGYVHAMAHTLGGFYGMPHGLANSIILPHVLEFYGKSAVRRLADLARKAGAAAVDLSDSEAASVFIERIKEMNRKMDIPEFVSGVEEKDLPLLVRRALAEANPLYPVPRILDRREMTELFAVVRGKG
jgi:alcohol dehydrogenase